MSLLRTFHHEDFALPDLVEAKRGRAITVCLPARNEEPTLAKIVHVIRRDLVERIGLVDEVLVIDDGSTDDTAAVGLAAGARVVASEGGPGKGQALWKGLAEADGEVVVFCDADVRNFGVRFVVGLLGPLLQHDGISFVKGFYERPLDGRAGEGGRVTELVARPLIDLLFPHLAPIAQPLAGEFAGHREVLERVPFVEGYGVDLGLLVDISDRFGVPSMAQVDLGVRVHRNRPLAELAPQAAAVLRTALDRASGADVDVPSRPPLVDVPGYRARRSA